MTHTNVPQSAWHAPTREESWEASKVLGKTARSASTGQDFKKATPKRKKPFVLGDEEEDGGGWVQMSKWEEAQEPTELVSVCGLGASPLC